MQAATVGDTYSYTAYETDGVTPINLSGMSSIVLAIQDPFGNTLTYTPSVSGNVFTFVTTANMFPLGGIYKVQFVVNYTGGNISKTRVATVTISPSID